MRFLHSNRNRGQNLVLKHKPLDTLGDPQEDQEDTDILDPGQLDGLPEAGTIGGGRC